MLRFISFGSGSCGNCYYIGNETDGIIVDAGIGIRRIKRYFSEYGVRTSTLKAVLVTHDHYDHIKSVGLLSDAYNIPAYATEDVHFGIERSYKMTHKISALRKRTVVKGEPFMVGRFEVTAFKIPHDSNENVGYTIKTDEGVFSVMTDVGFATESVKACIRNSNFLVFESNYDIDMLRTGRYPEQLKDRIMSGNGHLSNSECANALAECWHEGLRHVWLCHLSEENNHPELAQKTVDTKIAGLGNGASEITKVTVLRRQVPTGPFDNLVL